MVTLLLFSERPLYPLKDCNRDDGGGSQIADQEGDRIDEPGGYAEGPAVGQFIVDHLTAEFPAHKEDDQQATDEHQDISRDKVEEIENRLAEQLPVAQDTL